MTEQHSSTAVPLEAQCIQSISEDRRAEMEMASAEGKTDMYKGSGRREEKGRRGERERCKRCKAVGIGTEYPRKQKPASN